MFKDGTENVEIYFICYKRKEMRLIETYYDPILDVHSWYFNAYLAYKHWKKGFKKLHMGLLAKKMLTIAASKYIIYCLDEEVYRTRKEYEQLVKDSEIMEGELQKIIKEGEFIKDT